MVAPDVAVSAQAFEMGRFESRFQGALYAAFKEALYECSHRLFYFFLPPPGVLRMLRL